MSYVVIKYHINYSILKELSYKVEEVRNNVIIALYRKDNSIHDSVACLRIHQRQD